jgi:hypothetical protein
VDKEKWSIIKPFFKAEFTVESGDKLILDGLAFLAMEPSEHIRDYFGCLNKTCQIISNVYKSYANNPEEPTPDAICNIPITEVRKYKQECDENLLQFILLNLF